MPYKNEIFISYAHLDNEIAFQGQNGWITDFHRALEVRVAQLLGRKLTIWRDPKLTGNDVFSDTILEQLPQTAVLVTVLSPRYIKSEWCRREIHSFFEICSQTNGISLGSKSRVFKVIKTPLHHPVEQDLHPILQPLLGYEFFRVDPQSGHFHELDLAFGGEAKADYWLRLDDLAQDIASLLDEMLGQAKEQVPSRPIVYLAETSADVKELYAGIRRDLERKGYLVLPQRSLPLEEKEMEAFVRQQLEQSALSVHLFGSHYGVVPDGSTRSLIETQHELASEIAAQKRLVRLVWLPPDVLAEDDRQRNLIDRLKADVRWNKDADLLQTSIESLKTVIAERLSLLEEEQKKPTPPAHSSNQLERAYLICDASDRENIAPLREFLFEQGFEVLLPLFEGDEAEVRLDHEDNLQSCDLALIYHGLSHDLFLRRKLRELRKISAGPAERRLRLIAVCLAPPATPEKQQFRTHEAMLISQSDTFTPAAWEPLLKQFRAKGATA